MKSKISFKKRSLLIISIAVIALFLIVIFFLNSDFSGQVSYIKIIPPTNIETPQKVSVGLPVFLKIPKINTDTTIEYVGITPDGAMDVPKGPDGVAWFNLGPRPGDIGSAVISGHYGWKNGIPAVFDDLHKLEVGDKISVETEKTETIAFVVRELRSYGENDGASDVFSSDDGVSHLNLITCEGVWDKTRKSYSSRLVVFADKVDSTSSPQETE